MHVFYRYVMLWDTRPPPAKKATASTQQKTTPTTLASLDLLWKPFYKVQATHMCMTCTCSHNMVWRENMCRGVYTYMFCDTFSGNCCIQEGESKYKGQLLAQLNLWAYNRSMQFEDIQKWKYHTYEICFLAPSDTLTSF